jgi:hypothetical protein
MGLKHDEIVVKDLMIALEAEAVSEGGRPDLRGEVEEKDREIERLN